MVDRMGGICDTAKVFVVLVSLLLLALPVQAGPVEDVAPLPPWALTSDSTSSGMELSWNAPPGPVDGYRVYRADDAEAVLLEQWSAFSEIGYTTALTFTDSGPATESTEAGGIYYVTAVFRGAESLPSNPVDGSYPYCWSITTLTDCFLPPPI